MYKKVNLLYVYSSMNYHQWNTLWDLTYFYKRLNNSSFSKSKVCLNTVIIYLVVPNPRLVIKIPHRKVDQHMSFLDYVTCIYYSGR